MKKSAVKKFEELSSVVSEQGKLQDKINSLRQKLIEENPKWKAYFNAEDLLEENKKRVNELKGELYEEMKDEEEKTLENETLRATCTHAFTKRDFDSNKFKEDHPKLYKDYKMDKEVKGNVKITIKS